MPKKRKPIKDTRGYATVAIASKTTEDDMEKLRLALEKRKATDSSATPGDDRDGEDKVDETKLQPAVRKVVPVEQPLPDDNAALFRLTIEEERSLRDRVARLRSTREPARIRFGSGETLKALETCYVSLERYGFSVPSIENAIRRHGSDLSKCLTYLCLFQDDSELPPGYRSEFTIYSAMRGLQAGGEKGDEKLKLEILVSSKSSHSPAAAGDEFPTVGQLPTHRVVAEATSSSSPAKDRVGALERHSSDEKAWIVQRAAAMNFASEEDESNVMESGEEHEGTFQKVRSMPSKKQRERNAKKSKNEVKVPPVVAKKPAQNDVVPHDLPPTAPSEEDDTMVDLGSAMEMLTTETNETNGVSSASHYDEFVVPPPRPSPSNAKKSTHTQTTPRSILLDVAKQNGVELEFQTKRVGYVFFSTEMFLVEGGGGKRSGMTKIPLVPLVPSGKVARVEEVSVDVACVEAMLGVELDVSSPLARAKSLNLTARLAGAYRDLYNELKRKYLEVEEERERREAGPRTAFLESLLPLKKKREAADEGNVTTSARAEEEEEENDGKLLEEEKAVEMIQPKKSIIKMNPRRPVTTPILDPLASSRALLPVTAKVSEIIESINTNQVTIVVGATGSGKSTQVPQSLLRHAEAVRPSTVVVAEPRRISCVSLAQRVEQETGGQGLVGYRIRGKSTVTSRTRLVFATTGVLLREMASDALFTRYSHVVVDEVHERSLEGDVLLVALKRAVRQRSDLRVILMSATVDAAKLAQSFRPPPTLVPNPPLPPVIEASGRLFEVKTYFLDELPAILPAESREVLQRSPLMDPQGDSSSSSQFDWEAAYEVIEHTLAWVVATRALPDSPSSFSGTVLVFLPGVQEIYAAESRLTHSRLLAHALESSRGTERRAPLRLSLVRLWSQIENYDALFAPSVRDEVRVVLTTNVAETGVTVPEASIVIDSCRVNAVDFNQSKGVRVLRECFVSRASAVQRAGRAGRVREGICVRLARRDQFERGFKDYAEPEILRVPLDDVIVKILAMGHRDPNAFFEDALDAPSPNAVASAMKRLVEIGAVAEVVVPPTSSSSREYNLTLLGACFSKLAVEAKLAGFLLYADCLGIGPLALTIAAALQVTKSFYSTTNRRHDEGAGGEGATDQSDLIAIARLFHTLMSLPGHRERNTFAAQRGLVLTSFNQLGELRRDLAIDFQSQVASERTTRNGGRRAGDDRMSDRNEHLEAVRMLDDNVTLLQSVLYAGLYPSVIRARVNHHADSSPRVLQSGEGGVTVNVHPSSALRERVERKERGGVEGPYVDRLRDAYYSYAERIKTSRLFVSELTYLPPSGLLFFTPRVRFSHHSRRVDVMMRSGNVAGWNVRVGSGVTMAICDALRHAFFKGAWRRYLVGFAGAVGMEELVEEDGVAEGGGDVDAEEEDATVIGMVREFLMAGG